MGVSALKSSDGFTSFQKEAADMDIILSTTAALYKPKSEVRSENFHYGIGNIEDYTHFTSPIRRCADQLVHWTLKGKDVNRIDPELSKIPNEIFYTNKQLQREWNKLMGILRIHLDYPDGIPVKLVVFKEPYSENGQIGIEFLISGYEYHENHRNVLLRVRNDEDDSVDFIYKHMKDVSWDGIHGFHQVLVGTKMAAGSFCMKNGKKKGESNEQTVEIGEYLDGKMVYDKAELTTTYNVILKPTKLFMNSYEKPANRRKDKTDVADEIDKNVEGEDHSNNKQKELFTGKPYFKNWFFDYFDVEFLDVSVPGRFDN